MLRSFCVTVRIYGYRFDAEYHEGAVRLYARAVASKRPEDTCLVGTGQWADGMLSGFLAELCGSQEKSRKAYVRISRAIAKRLASVSRTEAAAIIEAVRVHAYVAHDIALMRLLRDAGIETLHKCSGAGHLFSSGVTGCEVCAPRWGLVGEPVTVRR